MSNPTATGPIHFQGTGGSARGATAASGALVTVASGVAMIPFRSPRRLEQVRRAGQSLCETISYGGGLEIQFLLAIAVGEVLVYQDQRPDDPVRSILLRDHDLEFGEVRHLL